MTLDFHLLIYIKGSITVRSDGERRSKVIKRQTSYKYRRSKKAYRRENRKGGSGLTLGTDTALALKENIKSSRVEDPNPRGNIPRALAVCRPGRDQFRQRTRTQPSDSRGFWVRVAVRHFSQSHMVSNFKSANDFSPLVRGYKGTGLGSKLPRLKTSVFPFSRRDFTSVS